MFYNNFPSTCFWVALAVSLHFCSVCLLSSTLFNLVYEAFLSWDWVHDLAFLNQASSTLALTPSKETLVEVAMTKAGLTLFNGTPFTEYGPVTNKLPEASDFKTTTLLPLCLPDNKITTLPGWTEVLPVNALGWFLFLLYNWPWSSAGYQVQALFLNLLWGDPPKAKVIRDDGTEMSSWWVLWGKSGLKMDGVGSDVFSEFVG